MNYQYVSEKLNQINTENKIWIIYIGIIFLSWYANSLEKNYFLFNDLESREKYRQMMIIIFLILVIIYLYFFSSSINDVKKLNKNDSIKKQSLTYLSFLGSLLIVFSGIIFLYIALSDQDLDVEIAFN